MLNIAKTGILNGVAVEPYLTLSDGSKWQLLLYHYVDNGNNLFTSTNCEYCNDFGLYSRLKWIDSFTYNNLYEFYVIQDGTAYRWTQTNAPLTTTAVSGFSAITGAPEGGICKCNNKTLLAATNTTDNWYRACGSWTKHTIGTRSGIPGFKTTGTARVCEDYLILYARITSPKAFAEDGVVQGVEFYEY